MKTLPNNKVYCIVDKPPVCRGKKRGVGEEMSVTLYTYPPCSTCRKARKWLQDNNVEFTEIHIVESTPSSNEIKQLHENSGLELKQFFNTSGKKYRELELKDKLPNATEEELYEILASDGMLIKRPIVTDGKKVTVGFKESDFSGAWTN